MRQLKHISHFAFLLLLILSIVAPSKQLYSQGALKVYVRLIIKKGETAGSKIVLYKNGQITEEVPLKSGRFELNLEYNNEFILSFEKPGYVTKKIAIDTNVPGAFRKDIEQVKQFEVELFKQANEKELLIYKNPVAKVRYASDIDDFDYDIDYSSTIQKQIDKETKALAEEIKKQEKEEAVKA